MNFAHLTLGWRFIRIAWMFALAFGFYLTPDAHAEEPPHLSIRGVSISNGSSPAIPQLTAGYLADVRFEAVWGRSKSLARTDIEILVDEVPTHTENLEFRDNMGTFQTRFKRSVSLPSGLSTGWHVLSVRITAPQTSIVSNVAGVRFYANANDDTSQQAIRRVLNEQSQDAALVFVQAIADRVAKHTKLTLPPLEVNGVMKFARLECKSRASVGYDNSFNLSDPTKGGRQLWIRSEIYIEGSESYWRSHSSKYPPIESFNPTGWDSDTQSCLNLGITPGYLLVSMSAQGRSNGSNQKYVRQKLSLSWYLDKATSDMVHVSINRDIPASSDLTSSDAPHYYNAMRDEAYVLAAEMVAAAKSTGYLDATWSNPTSAPTPQSSSDTPTDKTGSSGVKFDVGLSALNNAQLATPQAHLTQLGQQSAARAAAATAEAIPSAEGLSEIEAEIIAEIALTDQDPAAVVADFAAEEEALTASGSGDGLKLTQVSVKPERPNPGDLVTVTLTVHNSTSSGAPAFFDVGLTNYHDQNRDVAALKRRSLAPGARERFSLSFTAPRDYNFGGYAYVEPFVFSGDELPQEVVNLDINWDGSTMTDEEIAAELSERNPCPGDYEIADERLSRLTALYRQNQNEALATIEREAIAAQRERMDADYQARLNDPKFQQQVQLELDARANTQILAAYGELLKVAQRLGASNGLDLVAILDDEVFVDSKNRMHGDLALARRRIMAAVKIKQSQEISAVDRYLLAGVGNSDGTTAAYKTAEPAMSPTLTINGLAGELNTGAGKLIMKRIMGDYRALTEAYRNANTDLRDVHRYTSNLRELITEAGTKLKGSDRKFYADVLKDATRKLDKLDDLGRRAASVQKQAKSLLGKGKTLNGITSTIGTVGDLWAMYEVAERVSARSNQGEDVAQALLAEGSGWGAKKLITSNPVVASADAIMSGVGLAVKYMDPKFFKSKGIDPTHINASTLVDIGTGATIAGVTDSSAIMARRMERLPALTDEERAVLQARLAAFEARLDSTTDPVLRERLLTARSNVRQTLRERR